MLRLTTVHASASAQVSLVRIAMNMVGERRHLLTIMGSKGGGRWAGWRELTAAIRAEGGGEFSPLMLERKNGIQS